jgi:microcystin-dependent protein
MADPFVAEIRAVPFNFAPVGWALCDGQLLPISQNTALFSLLGTTYGGDGRTTFALPNLQGRVLMHPGQGAGLSEHVLGETGGVTTHAVTQDQLPAHNHTLKAVPMPGTLASPLNAALAKGGGNAALYASASTVSGTLHTQAVATAGASLPHNNLQPYLVLNYIIALQGVFPSRW